MTMILSLNHYIFRAYNEGKSCCSKNTERNEIGMGSHGPGLRSSRGRHCHHSSSFGLSPPLPLGWWHHLWRAPYHRHNYRHLTIEFYLVQIKEISHNWVFIWCKSNDQNLHLYFTSPYCQTNTVDLWNWSTFNDRDSWQSTQSEEKKTNWQLWNQAATFRINNKCENLIFKPLSLIYQAAPWSTTLPTLKIQTTLYTKLSTVPWNVLSTQTRLVVLSSGAGTTRTRRATQKLRTLGELWRQQVEPRLAQWNVDHQEEQARISLLKI